MTPRLDAALAARGLARSRTHAATLIADGLVTVDGRPVVKASTQVADDAALEVAGADHYVSRAAHKLIAGLDAFDVDVAAGSRSTWARRPAASRRCCASAAPSPVIAVDVGHGQLAASVAIDPGVISIEGFNVRYMTPESLAEAQRHRRARRRSSPAICRSSRSPTCCRPRARSRRADADLVLLVKPQFEVGRTAVKGGLVTDAATRADAVAGVLWAAWDVGLGTCGVVSSPIAGTHGNAEYIAHLAPGRGSNPTEWLSTVNRLAGSP